MWPNFNSLIWLLNLSRFLISLITSLIIYLLYHILKPKFCWFIREIKNKIKLILDKNAIVPPNTNDVSDDSPDLEMLEHLKDTIKELTKRNLNYIVQIKYYQDYIERIMKQKQYNLSRPKSHSYICHQSELNSNDNQEHLELFDNSCSGDGDRKSLFCSTRRGKTSWKTNQPVGESAGGSGIRNKFLSANSLTSKTMKNIYFNAPITTEQYSANDIGLIQLTDFNKNNIEYFYPNDDATEIIGHHDENQQNDCIGNSQQCVDIKKLPLFKKALALKKLCDNFSSPE